MGKQPLKKTVFDFFFGHSWLLNNYISARMYVVFREIFKDTSIMKAPHSQRRLLLEQFRVYDTLLSKIRLGSANDGGYVVIDLENAYDGLLSYGIGRDNSFELDWVVRYQKKAYLFDHTISELNADHDLLTFVHEGISSNQGIQTNTLDSHLLRFGSENSSNWFLKLDIEGAEWDILSGIDPNHLAKFSQVVIEFHDINSMKTPLSVKIEVLSKLNNQFYLVHAHANNFSHVLRNDGIYANVIELTFLRRDMIDLSKFLRTPLPLSIDAPNYKYLEDHCLDGFPFINQK